jgi:NAD+ synthase
MNIYRDPQVLVEKIAGWISRQIIGSARSGGIVGLSGGIDSAVVAALLKQVCGEGMLAVMMPCHSAPGDMDDAIEIVKKFDLPWLKVDLSDTYDALTRSLPVSTQEPGLHLSNIKPRLRMTTLYALGQHKGLLVCGTGNRAELAMGYFTKYGDSGVDILPLGDLLKGEVTMVAKELGVPPGIIKKPPSAGLWPGQTDEEELGMTYMQIDRYLATGEAEPGVADRVDKAFSRTAHKRVSAPICRI